MGAWGVLAFDNDDANDWANGLKKATDLSLIETTFAEVEAAGDYLEAPVACSALAACEVLARLKGKIGYRNTSTEKVDQWVARHPIKPSPDILSCASSIIDRILGENSELRELWEDGDGDDWLASVEELRGRLRD